jgi:hypothetical protein
MRLENGKSLITKRSIGQIALLMFALAPPAQTWAQADTSKQMEQADAAQTFRQGRLLDTFGKWQIRKGLVRMTQSGHQCFARRAIGSRRIDHSARCLGVLESHIGQG